MLFFAKVVALKMRNMHTFFFLIILSLFLGACAGSSSQEDKPQKTTDSLAFTQDKPQPQVDPARTYPFLELKALYAQDWQGEEEGNPLLDGQMAKLEGRVFNVSRISKLEGSQVVLQALKIEFRSGDSQEDSFAHDVECHFSPQMLLPLEEIEPDSLVRVQGRLFGQEVTVTGDSTYTTLILKDCELL